MILKGYMQVCNGPWALSKCIEGLCYCYGPRQVTDTVRELRNSILPTQAGRYVDGEDPHTVG